MIKIRLYTQQVRPNFHRRSLIFTVIIGIFTLKIWSFTRKIGPTFTVGSTYFCMENWFNVIIGQSSAVKGLLFR